jgi:hypothetical protein
VNLLGDNIDNMRENTKTLIDASKEVGPEISVKETKYMLLSRHQNVDQNRDVKTANRSRFYYYYLLNNKNFVAIGGHHNKVLVTNATECNPQI